MTDSPTTPDSDADAAAAGEHQPVVHDLNDGSEYSQHILQGLKLYDQHDLTAALEAFAAAAALDEHDGTSRLMQGVVLRDLERDVEARAMLESLINQNDVKPMAHNSLAVLANRRGDYAAAIEHCRSAVAASFQFAPAHFQLAISLLADGQYREGFREYEWRWHMPEFQRLNCSQPRWTGQKLDGTLLVHTEQGTEDTIHFCRYLPLLREQCQRLLLVCSPTMGPILSAPDWADEVCFPGEIPNESFDAYLPLLSAPTVFHTDLATIPSTVPYIQLPVEAVKLDTSHVPQSKLRVGVAWSCGPIDMADTSRYAELSALDAIFKVPQVAFFNLQKRPDGSAFDVSQSEYPMVRNMGAAWSDLRQLAGALSGLDLLIATDCTAAHLAGALGIPAWILLARRHHWRWMHDRQDSPWYPTVRLFRQTTPHDWNDVTARVAMELGRIVEGDAELQPARTTGEQQ